jgi:hypothetical protein
MLFVWCYSLSEVSLKSPTFLSDIGSIKMKMSIERWWNDTDRGRTKYSDKTSTIVTLFPNLIWSDPGLNPDLRGERLTTSVWATARPDRVFSCCVCCFLSRTRSIMPRFITKFIPYCMTFWVITAVLMNVQGFMYVTPCGLATYNMSQRCTNLMRQVAMATDYFYYSA